MASIIIFKGGLTMKARFLTCFVFVLVLSFLSLSISPTTFATPTMPGHVTEYRIQTTLTKPYFITQDRNNNLWFTKYASNMIKRITTTDTMTAFPLPHDYSAPYDITSDPD